MAVAEMQQPLAIPSTATPSERVMLIARHLRTQSPSASFETSVETFLGLDLMEHAAAVRDVLLRMGALRAVQLADEWVRSHTKQQARQLGSPVPMGAPRATSVAATAVAAGLTTTFADFYQKWPLGGRSLGLCTAAELRTEAARERANARGRLLVARFYDWLADQTGPEQRVQDVVPASVAAAKYAELSQPRTRVRQA